jgi:2-oxoglutarate ferredoxin oxidoreductase subunit beta
MEATATVDFVPSRKEITASYEKGADVRMHDGSFIHLEKLAAHIDPRDRLSAIHALQTARNHDEILTGLLYIEPDSSDLHSTIQTSDRALNSLGQDELCPGAAVLEGINKGLR